MKVKTIIEGRLKVYSLTITRKDFAHMCAGYPENGSISGQAKDGTRFDLYEGSSIPPSFELTPDRDGYFAYVGADVPTLPEGATNDDFERLNQQADDSLESAINNSYKIPIYGNGRRSIIAYVELRVEKE